MVLKVPALKIYPFGAPFSASVCTKKCFFGFLLRSAKNAPVLLLGTPFYAFSGRTQPLQGHF